MTDGVLAVVQNGDSLVHGGQHFLNGHSLYADTRKKFWVRKHLPEGKTAAQRRVQSGDRPICGVHGADQINIFGYAERFLRIRKKSEDALWLSLPFGRLDKGDQLAENLGNISAVDFINNEHITGFIGRGVGSSARMDGLGRIFFNHPIYVCQRDVGHTVDGGQGHRYPAVAL